jgi:hypothetical protein
MKMTLANAGVALAFCLALVFASAGSCDTKSQPKPKPAMTCQPGDTRASKGHTDVCNKDGNWTPMRKQVKP